MIWEPRRAFVKAADTVVQDHPGWFQLRTPSFKHGGINEVSWAVLPDTEVEARVVETQREYAQDNLQWRWVLGPDSGPSTLGAVLAERGGQPIELAAMWRSSEDLVVPPPPGALELLRVGPAEVEDYVQVLAQGWGLDAGPLLEFKQRVLAAHRETHPMWLARFEGRPAAVANAAWLSHALYLQGSVVLPEFRGRGLYRTLVALRLAEARRRGCPRVTVRARADSSAPILAELGFSTAWRFTTYEFGR